MEDRKHGTMPSCAKHAAIVRKATQHAVKCGPPEPREVDHGGPGTLSFWQWQLKTMYLFVTMEAVDRFSKSHYLPAGIDVGKAWEERGEPARPK